MTIGKLGPRWTLRELFTSAWEDREFEIRCTRCGHTWPAPLLGSPVSIASRLDADATEPDHDAGFRESQRDRDDESAAQRDDLPQKASGARRWGLFRG